MASELAVSLLGACPVVPAPLLRRVHEVAAGRGDLAVLRRLARRGDLPEDVEVALAGLGDAQVAGALADRRPEGAVVGERRHGVLARLVSTSGTPDPVAFAAAVEELVARPSRTLFEALKRHPASWFTAQQAAAMVVVHDRVGGPFTGVWSFVDRIGPDLLGQVARVVRRWSTVDALAVHGMSDEQRLELLVDLVRCGVDEDVLAAWVRSMQRYAVDPDGLRERLLGFVAEHRPEVLGAVSVQVRRRSVRVRSWDLSAADPPVGVACTLPVLLRLACGDDPVGVDQAVSALASWSGDRGAVEAVSCAVLRNPASGKGTVVRLIELLERKAWASDALREMDVIAVWEHDVDVARAWAKVAREQTLRKYGWGPFGGQHLAAELLTGWVGSATPDLLVAVVHAGLTEQNLRDLPVPVLAAFTAVPVAAGPVLDRVARLLSDRVGSGVDAWAVLEALEDGFTGTFGELCDIAAAVAAPAP